MASRRTPLNQIKFGAVLSYVSLALGTVVSLLYTPIMLQRLGESEYGVYNLVLPVISYLNLLSFGLGSAYTRYYARRKAENDQAGMAKLNGMFLTIYLLLGAVVLALGLLISFNAPFVFGTKLKPEELELAKRLMIVLSFNAAISFPISVFESHVMINERYVFQKLVAMIRSVLSPLIMIPLLLMGFRSETLVLLTLIVTLVSGVLNVYYCFRKLHMPIRMRAFDFPLMREMLRFTSFVFIGIVVDQLNWSIDRLLLGWLHGTTAVTVYVQASQLNLYYLSLATAFSGVLTPRVHHMVASGESDRELSRLFARTGRLQFILMSLVLLGFVAVGRPFIVLWSGGNWSLYSVSYFIGLILFASTLLPSIQSVGIEIQRAKNMHKFRSLVYLGVAIGNILFSLPLTMRWQGLGASIGTFVSTFVGNVLLMNWYYHKRIGLDIPLFWRQIARMLPALVIPAASAVAIACFAPVTSYLGVALWGAVLVAVFIPNMWVLGMNRYEKDLVLGAVRRVLPRKRAS